MHHHRLGLVPIVLALSIVPVPARAALISPTWTASVQTDTTVDLSTNIYTTTTTTASWLGGDGSISVASFQDWFTSTSDVFSTIVDFQGAHPAIDLEITAAQWNYQTWTGGTVPLEIYGWGASATPPDLTSPPTGVLVQEALIPTGTTSDDPYLIPLSPGSLSALGNEAFLFVIGDFDPHLGAMSIAGELVSDAVPVTSTAAVPEPSSLIVAVAGIVAGLGYAWRRRSAQ